MIGDDEQSENERVNQVPARLSFTALSKTFGATRALNNVSLDLLAGEIHGLVGQNGSGKSTLIKVLAGYYEPDAGSQLSIDGAPVRLPLPPGDYSKYGISFVHQDLALIPSLTVLENLRVNDLCLKSRWYISWKEEIREAEKLLKEFDLDLDPQIRIEEVDVGSRALLAIVRAMDGMRKGQTGRTAGLLVLDEPTAFLTGSDVERLFVLARRIKAQGASVLFVSHDLDEVLDLTDRVTVIRDGALAGTFISREVTKNSLVERIIGHPLSDENKDGLREEDLRKTTPAISVTDLDGEYVHGISFEIKEGEIVGMSGLLGSGFADVPSLLFGAKRAAAGILRVGKESYPLPAINPWKALEAGITLIPVDRRGEGIVEDLSIIENISLPVLKHFGPWRLQHANLRSTAEKLVRDFDVRPIDPENRVANLSGGNQQKVLLAKWLQIKPKLILLDEPTQGVDVGAREQIYQLLRKQAATGAMILCASSDYEELATLCGRVLIFSRGRIVEELLGTQLTKEAIAQRCHVG
jgi:ribose transport system ATP-binding protein